jgi:hypothetical protein
VWPEYEINPMLLACCIAFCVFSCKAFALYKRKTAAFSGNRIPGWTVYLIRPTQVGPVWMTASNYPIAGSPPISFTPLRQLLESWETSHGLEPSVRIGTARKTSSFWPITSVGQWPAGLLAAQRSVSATRIEHLVLRKPAHHLRLKKWNIVRLAVQLIAWMEFDLNFEFQRLSCLTVVNIRYSLSTRSAFLHKFDITFTCVFLCFTTE